MTTTNSNSISFIEQVYPDAVSPEQNIIVVSGPRLTNNHPWVQCEEFRTKAAISSALATTCSKETTSFSGETGDSGTHEIIKSGDLIYVTGSHNFGAETTFVSQKKK